ncbi:MAG: bifunctional hydroxymethylpyrimidine kinase/phosphomethylpyrimidine kinase [Pirellulaceae bacterium]
MIDLSRAEREVTIATNATVLTIGGSDPSGGAGLQADLKTFQQLGCYGMAVVSLLTVQNTQGVDGIELVSADFVTKQLDAVTHDIVPRVIKTGALGSADLIEAVAVRLSELKLPVVVDPVLISKHGHSLADDSAIQAYRNLLMPLATLFTPNRFEAAALLGRELNSAQDFAQAAADLLSLGPSFVLLKAGTINGRQHHMFASEEGVQGIEMPTLESNNTHGAGCVLSAAISGCLAIRLSDVVEPAIVLEAVRFALSAVHNAIEFAPELGKGVGPVETRVVHLGDQ